MDEKEKKYGIIYKATNKENGKVYIGQTVRTLEERRYEHEWDAKNGSATYFHKALRKYRFDNFTWEVIDTAKSIEELNEKEKYWIAFYDSYNNGYNLTLGGGATLGWKPSEETRRKIGEASKRMWQDEGCRQKIIEAMKRRTLSEETRRKISEALKGENNPFYGKTHTEETRRKLSEALKERELSEEHRKKIGEASKIMWQNEDYRKKVSEARKGKYVGETHHSAKLNELQAVFILAISPIIKTRQNRNAEVKQSEIGEWLGVGQSLISNILNGQKWKHLPTFEEIRDIWRELYEKEYGDKENKNVSTDNKSGAA